MSDFKVKIEYKNEKMETVVEKEYDFQQYTEMLHLDLMHILSDVEAAFYHFCDGKSKDDWPEEEKKRFQAIRHKILDEANALRRLPRTLNYKGVHPADINAGVYFASLWGKQ